MMPMILVRDICVNGSLATKLKPKYGFCVNNGYTIETFEPKKKNLEQKLKKKIHQRKKNMVFFLRIQVRNHFLWNLIERERAMTF